MEKTTQEPALKNFPDWVKYEWTEDFLISNHLLEASSRPGGMAAGTKAYRFTHDSFYEYFVAGAVADRIASGHSLGLRPGSFAQAIFDSLTMYFVRTGLERASILNIIEIVRRPKLSWPDRMLLLYMLEDEPEFPDLLKSTPSDYLDLLQAEFQSAGSIFLRKMIMYQLVLVGRASAYDYVELARQHEEAQDVELESLTQGAEANTPYLLQRLRSESLRPAMPISVYRLGQMGDRSCLPDLFAAAQREPGLRSLVEEAISRIEARHPDSKPVISEGGGS